MGCRPRKLAQGPRVTSKPCQAQSSQSPRLSESRVPALPPLGPTETRLWGPGDPFFQQTHELRFSSENTAGSWQLRAGRGHRGRAGSESLLGVHELGTQQLGPTQGRHDRETAPPLGPAWLPVAPLQTPGRGRRGAGAVASTPQKRTTAGRSGAAADLACVDPPLLGGQHQARAGPLQTVGPGCPHRPQSTSCPSLGLSFPIC